MIRLGPITIMRTSEREAYAVLANAAYVVHQAIWYSDEMDEEHFKLIRKLDEGLAAALSHTPAADIVSTE